MLNTQRYLLIAGWTLLTASLLGFLALGPTSSNSLLGSGLYLDIPQNILHALLGVACLAYVRFVHSDRSLRIASGALGVLTLIISVLAFLNYQNPAPNVGFLNVEGLDTGLYLAMALIGFWVAFMPDGPMFVKEDKQLTKTA